MHTETLDPPAINTPTPRAGVSAQASGRPAWPAEASTGESSSSPAQAEPFQSNRRSSPRYTAVKDLLWVGWWADDEFVIVEANLVNISEGGVLVALNPSPPMGQPVWMRLDGSFSYESLRAVVLDTRWMRLKRKYAVRLKFEAACPNSFYETAVYGRATQTPPF